MVRRLFKRNDIVGLKSDDYFVRAGRIIRYCQNGQYEVILADGEKHYVTEDEIQHIDYTGMWVPAHSSYPDWFMNKLMDLSTTEYYDIMHKHNLVYKADDGMFYHRMVWRPMPSIRQLKKQYNKLKEF